MSKIYRIRKSEDPLQAKSRIESFYSALGLKVDSFNFGTEAKEKKYGACNFTLNGKNVQFRIANTTQDRPGQFVTLWKRSIETEKIEPFDESDEVDFVVVCVEATSLSGTKYEGQFMFPFEILISKGVFSSDESKGKLAMRVFPPWSEEISIELVERNEDSSIGLKKTNKMSAAAKKTQKWQLGYFMSTDRDGFSDNGKFFKNILGV